jgi:Domain of unknown function (DUF5753)
MERQQLLDRDHPLELWAVVGEAAIRRLVGGQEIMHDQLTHLIKAARKPNVTIQVIPFEAGAHPGMPGSFVHMDFKDPPRTRPSASRQSRRTRAYGPRTLP